MASRSALRVTQMTFVCFTVYMENISAATISMACSSRTKASSLPLPGSAMTRSHWRGIGTSPSVTPSAPRFFAFLASLTAALSVFPSLSAFAFAASFLRCRSASSFRRTTTYRAPFSRWGKGWRALMICGDRNGMTLSCT